MNTNLTGLSFSNPEVINPKTVEKPVKESEADERFRFASKISNDDEFEFPFVFQEADKCIITADEIFSNGKIRPIFRSLESNSWGEKNVPKPPVKTFRRSLSSLFIEGQDFDPLSCSTSETDGVSPDTYCKWAPHKSKSMRSSKRWKLLSIIRRCKSEITDVLDP